MMKRGDEVYFIVKNVVRKGLVSDYLGNDVTVFYEKGNSRKLYKLKKSEIAFEIERGTNGTDGLGVASKSSNNESVTRCDKSDRRLFVGGVSNERGAGESKRVFKGAWQIFNVA